MNLDVLVSTMFDSPELYKKMNIQGSAIIINQTDYEAAETIKLKDDERIKFISTTDRGLAKSRNQAINESDAAICLFADNDVTYVDGYIKTIEQAYQKYPEADIIAFTVTGEGNNRSVSRLKTGSVNRVMSMKISSVQISFKRSAIKEHQLSLNENFGVGSNKFNSGEENIFLYQAIKKGLKVYYVDEKIGEVSFEESTWYGQDRKKDLLTKGAMFYQMSSWLYPLYNLQFAMRKQKEFQADFSLWQIIKLLFQGSKEGKS